MSFLLPFGEPLGNNADTRTVSLLVVGDIVPSPALMAEVERVFNDHMARIRLSLAGFHVEDERLSDGSTVQIISNSGQHQIIVRPVAQGGISELWHGFGVKHAWHDPVFYRKVGDTWVPGRSPQQLREGKVTYNHVQRFKGGRWVFVPLVMGRDAKRVWDLSPHGGFDLTAEDAELPEKSPDESDNIFVPFSLELEGKWTPHPMHYAVDDAILARDGTRLYTMEPMEPLGEEDTTLYKLPACTSGGGEEIALLQWRELLVSPTFDIWHMRWAAEILTRTAKDAFALQDRKETELSTQQMLDIGGSTYEAGTRDEPPEPSMRRVVRYVRAGWWAMNPPNPVTGEDYGWATEGVELGDTILDKTPTIDGGREIREPTPPTPVVTDYVLAVPGSSSIEFVKLINALAYPFELLLAAASHSVGLNLDPLPDGWGVLGGQVMERELYHRSTAEPSMKMDFGWTVVPMFEGTVDATAEAARSYIDKRTRDTYTDPMYLDPGRPWTPLLVIYDYEPCDNESCTLYGHGKWQAAIATRIPFDQYLIDYPNATTRIEEDNRPIEIDGSYIYKSWYIIDYDHRARFCASIRVEVQCSGARWEQKPDGYRGEVEATEDPTYTARVYFEARFDGGDGVQTLQQLLVEDTFIKPAAEFTYTDYDNVLEYPAADPSEPLRVYMPPEIQPPHEAYSQIKNIARHQGVNPYLASQEAIAVPDSQDSPTELERSTYGNGIEYPHAKRPGVRLYARTINLADFEDTALWLLHKTYVSAPQNQDYGSPDTALYHYAPNIGDAISEGVKFRIEIRDDELVTWTDDIPAAQGQVRPAPEDRDTEVYYL